MREYEEIWEKFKSERRLNFGGHTDPQWRHKHKTSVSFVVPVEASPLRERLEPLREALRPMSFVSLHPDYFMHITLLILGFFVPQARKKDELSAKRLAELKEKAQDALSDFPAFPVTLANLNAFPGAAFIEAHANGMLEELQERLSVSCGLRKPPGPPHLTLAYFHAPDNSTAPEGLISAIERYRNWPVGEIQADRVHLSLLNLQQDYPEPEVAAEILLVDGRGRLKATPVRGAPSA